MWCKPIQSHVAHIGLGTSHQKRQASFAIRATLYMFRHSYFVMHVLPDAFRNEHARGTVYHVAIAERRYGRPVESIH
jgi:hypothetical protein